MLRSLRKLLVFLAKVTAGAVLIAIGVVVLEHAFELMTIDSYPFEVAGLIGLAGGISGVLLGVWRLVSSFYPENMVVRE